MLSVNTNYSAMVALQNLNMTNTELEEVQGRINTGFKVANAKDNGAVFAIAETQRARSSSIAAVADGIDRASAAVDVGLAAGEAIGKILRDMKTKSVAAQAADLTTEQRNALQADYDAMRAQIDQIANSAQFNGINLVSAGGANLSVLMSDLSTGATGRMVQSTVIAGEVPGLSAYVVGSGGVTAADDTTFNLNGVAIGTVDITATMTIQQYLDAVSTQTGNRVTASYNQSTGQFSYIAKEAIITTNELTLTTAGTARSFLGHGVAAAAVSGGAVTSTITNLDFTVGGAGALSTISAAASLLASTGSATTTSGNIDTAIVTLNQQLASLGSQAKALDVQNEFLGKLQDVVDKGIGNLVDADLAKESAKLQSLQIKQQLGAQALSIANQSPQVILSLFRS
ncbi:MAG: flagellin [Alphaproteobacteria bacterium]|nr:flagellin [Alphaproteobacteria bacterium]